MEISKITKETLINLMKEGKRIDGRKPNEIRDINIMLNISKNAEGSALVEIGKTKVVAGVKIELTQPFLDSPDEGILVVNAEFLPLAYREFEPGPPGTEAIELARIIDRTIRESETIDLKKLCIEEGKKVYAIFLDIYILNHDGNLVDASFLASLLALLNSYLPKIEKRYEDFVVVYGEKTKEKLPIKKIPFLITAYRLGKEWFLDANLIEEKATDAIISIGFTFEKEKRIHATQKFTGLIDFEELEKVLNICEEGYKKIKKYLEEKNVLKI
jgi:exosome complex component RRP42